LGERWRRSEIISILAAYDRNGNLTIKKKIVALSIALKNRFTQQFFFGIENLSLPGGKWASGCDEFKCRNVQTNEPEKEMIVVHISTLMLKLDEAILLRRFKNHSLVPFGQK
jgi:hypothetical protein